jgi:hypothetical protein
MPEGSSGWCGDVEPPLMPLQPHRTHCTLGVKSNNTLYGKVQPYLPNATCQGKRDIIKALKCRFEVSAEGN